MGSRLSCSCSEAYCFGGDDRRLRIHAELFELSACGSRWIMVEQRLLYITVHRTAFAQARVSATTSAGRTVVDSTISPNCAVEKISECFVFWKDVGGRTLGVNTLSARDANSFLSVCSTKDSSLTLRTAGLFQQSTICQVSQLAVFDKTRVVLKKLPAETTMVAVNPLALVFHYNHQLINVDLLECVVTSGPADTILHLAHQRTVYQFEFSQPAVPFLAQVLNLSSLLLARTTSTDVAIATLQKHRMRVRSKLSSTVVSGEDPSDWSREKWTMKDVCLQARLKALSSNTTLQLKEALSCLSARLLQYSLPDCPLPSIYLALSQLHSFRMFRKTSDGRASDLRALSPTNNMTMSNTASSSTDMMFNVLLPNGTTTVVTHKNSNKSELLDKVCEKLGIDSHLFDLVLELNDEYRLILRTEYQVEKKHGRLGLTIYASQQDDGKVRAEVRGVAVFSPGGPAVGDTVVSVDGQPIAKVPSASDVERLLRDGTKIVLKRRTVAKEFDQRTNHIAQWDRSPRPSAVPPPSAVTPLRLEGKLHRSIQELLTTEQKYVRDLKQMVDLYLCIGSVRETMEAALRLEAMQEAFLEALQEAVSDAAHDGALHAQVRDAVMRVCALFVNRSSEFKVYAEYAAAYLTLQQELKENKTLHAQLEAANFTGAQHCSYESRMIKPVQRVVQYPLLLKTIAAGCESGSLEARQVETALQKMQTVAEYVNEMQRIHEQFAPHLQSISETHKEMFTAKKLRIDVRDLLIFAHVRWLNADQKTSQEYVMFVFACLLLLVPSDSRMSAKAKYYRVLPINEVEVSEGRADDGLLLLVHTPETRLTVCEAKAKPRLPEPVPFQISCCQPLLKHQLAKNINKARNAFIKEHRRPLSGSSQSDGGYSSEPAKDIPIPK